MAKTKAAATSKNKKRKKKKKKYIPGPPIQYHHQVYEPRNGEIVGTTAGHIFKGEHSVITALRRQTRNISSFFLSCLEEWLENAKVRTDIRNVDQEIEQLEEGQSWHCRYCGRGFLVKKNRERHEGVCHNNYFDRKGISDAIHKTGQEKGRSGQKDSRPYNRARIQQGRKNKGR